MTNPPLPGTGEQLPDERSEAKTGPGADRPPQLSLAKIVSIWCAAAIPMPVLAFGVAPLISERTGITSGTALLICMIAGMALQGILAIVLLCRERRIDGGRLNWRERIWWRTPCDPKTGRKRRVLLLLVVPIFFASMAIEQSGIGDVLAQHLLWLAPWLGDIPTPDIRQLADPSLHGAWWLVPLMLTLCIFNYALGEALLFHGFLLPRLHGVFGKWDWLWNGVLFGGYHLIRPLTIPSIMVTGAIWAYFSIRHRSSQIAIYTHAIDAIMVMGLTLAVVTGHLP